mmetsp:Transcript_27569/g.52471  ORF Transcript_27569/g.52471 Transcript_27569/m.52471 type:complete len:136 (-) Transcript_27569:1749-2156(-)
MSLDASKMRMHDCEETVSDNDSGISTMSRPQTQLCVIVCFARRQSVGIPSSISYAAGWRCPSIIALQHVAVMFDEILGPDQRIVFGLGHTISTATILHVSSELERSGALPGPAADWQLRDDARASLRTSVESSQP